MSGARAADLVRDERVVATVGRAVEQVNSWLAHWETIKHFRLLARDFEEAEGERTPSLKVKRAAVHRRNAELIDEMYSSGTKG